MVNCYRVGDCTVGNDMFVVRTYSLAPWNTDIDRLLSHLGGQVELMSRHSEEDDFRAVYQYRGVQSAKIEGVFAAHRRPAVTMMTSADLAVALDFYSRPPLGDAGVPQRTASGDRMYFAKYRNDVAAREEIGRIAAAFVAGHPLLAKSDAVVAMPGQESGGAQPLSIALEMAHAIRDQGGLSLANLARAADVPSRRENRYASHEGSMAADDVTNRVVIVVDDAVRDGGTIEEAYRALKAAGAWRVFVLAAAKDWTGTRRFRREDD